MYNLSYRIPNFYPVYFHNLSGYDAHLFIKNLSVSEGDIKCIPSNEEKYISFSKTIVVDIFTNKDGKEVDIKREIRFIDSFRFMQCSLANLVGNLDKEQCKNMAKFFKGEELDLLLRKGVYPYDFMNRFAKLKERSLPPKEAFFSKLMDADISDVD